MYSIIEIYDFLLFSSYLMAFKSSIIAFKIVLSPILKEATVKISSLVAPASYVFLTCLDIAFISLERKIFPNNTSSFLL